MNRRRAKCRVRHRSRDLHGWFWVDREIGEDQGGCLHDLCRCFQQQVDLERFDLAESSLMMHTLQGSVIRSQFTLSFDNGTQVSQGICQAGPAVLRGQSAGQHFQDAIDR